VAAIKELAGVAHDAGLSVHLDGARIFNAAAALGTSPAEIGAPADSVSFCLSKGLGCPVGSLLCGPGEYISLARRHRKMLGGGMRQAGVLAAAGLYALENNVARIASDHRNAARLASGLRAMGPFRPNDPMTNIVIADLLEGDNDTWLARLENAGVLAVGFGARRLRMVTHVNIGAEDIEEALGRIASAVEAVPA
jgi:threonine aldolase